MTKQELLQQEQARAQAARGLPIPTPPTGSPLPPRQAHISESAQGPIGHDMFGVVNSWTGPVGDKWLVVYAGGGPITKNRAGLLVYSEPVDPNQSGFTPVGAYPAPSNHPEFEIIAVDGPIMTLKTGENSTLSFDLSTLSYLQ